MSGWINKVLYNTTGNGSRYDSFQSLPSFTTILLLLKGQAGLIMVVNISIFCFVALNKTLNKNPSNLFLLSLFLSHIILGISGFIKAFRQSDYLINIIITSILAGFLSLVLVTIDRYVAIKYPFQHQKLTRFVAITVTFLVVWLPTSITIIYLLTLNLDIKFSQILCVAIILIAAMVLISTNIYVYSIARTHIKRIKNINVETNQVRNQRRRKQRTMKPIYICATIVFTFLITWMPTLVVNFLVILNKLTLKEKIMTFTYTIPMASIDCIINPIIYVVFNRQIRVEIVKIIRKYLCSRIFNGKGNDKTIKTTQKASFAEQNVSVESKL